LVPVENTKSSGRKLDELLQPDAVSPPLSNLAALLQPSPPGNKKGGQRRRSYDVVVNSAFKGRKYDPASSPVTGEYAFSLETAMASPVPPKIEGPANPHVRPGAVLTVAAEERMESSKRKGRKSFKAALSERPTALQGDKNVAKDHKPAAPKVRRSFAGITKAGLANTRLSRGSRGSISKVPSTESEHVVVITDPPIQQALKTRDKQRGAQERRKSLDEKRRSSLTSVNELKKRRRFEHLTKETEMIRKSDLRLAPIKAWLMCMTLYKRHETFKRTLNDSRETKAIRGAALRIQSGWRTRPKEKKYADLIAIIDKHRAKSMYKVVMKRKKDAGMALQKLLTHKYRNKRFTGWGALIRDRTVKVQRAFRSYSKCTDCRIRTLLNLWNRAMWTKDGRGKLAKIKLEVLGNGDGDLGGVNDLVKIWARTWIKESRKKFTKSQNSTFFDVAVSSKASSMLPVFSLNDAQALLTSDTPLQIPQQEVAREETRIECGLKMKPFKAPRRVWGNLMLYCGKQDSDFCAFALERYREHLSSMAKVEQKSPSPPPKKQPERPRRPSEVEGHRLKFGLGYSIA